jgi:DNA repair exonuclease SbcCD nuclease subunit
LKFAHISDTHIKNLKYHSEYNIVFDKIYEELKSNKIDYIIHTGDIAHTKTQISPEFVQMCSQFFRNLSSIAPTYIILGNHDGNLKNSNRQDAISPIVNALNLPNLFLLKDSGEVHLDDRFCLNVLSVFDRDNWQEPSEPNKINIALYHGSISNCQTDTNWVMSSGEDDISIFEEFDFAMLGDIHMRQQMDTEGRVWYAGSTIQQNHGEFDNKGFLIWDIEDKDSFEVKPVLIPNPVPFCTIILENDGSIPKDISAPKNARLRVVSNSNLPLETMRKAIDVVKHRFEPETISFLNRVSGERKEIKQINEGFKIENLRDIQVQEKIISEYLEDYEVDSETIKSVFELNKKYNQIVESKDDVSRNTNWKLRRFEWDNLFNYGEKNVINFDNMSGIIGIFGKNFSGKSSVIDAALYTMFNTTTKNERKNLNVVNQNKPYGSGFLEIQIGDDIYKIRRTSEKYTKRTKSGDTTEAKTDLDFEKIDAVTGETISLNGTTRNKTDENIRKTFGTIEDFSMSSLASQHGAFSFIEEGSTKRKEIIAKFLDLIVFDQKFKTAKEDFVGYRALIKKNENRNFEEEITNTREEVEKFKQQTNQNIKRCEELNASLASLQTELSNIEQQIESLPANVSDITSLLSQKQSALDNISLLVESISNDSAAISSKENRLQKAKLFLSSIDVEDLKSKKREADNLKNIAKGLKVELDDISKKENLLSSIPCGDQFPTCRFIKDAHVSVLSKDSVESQMKKTINQFKLLKVDEVETRFKQYNEIVKLQDTLQKEVSSLKIKVERTYNTKTNKEYELRDIDAKIEEYNQNKDVIENLQNLIELKKGLNKKIKKAESERNKCEKSNISLYKNVGSAEQKLINIREQKETHDKVLKEYSACDLFLRCMHPNGIAYDIIKKRIPVINEEIAKILTNVVSFEVFFESNGNKLDIFIKHPSHDPRPIEMGSGAEKTMAAIAIRLALLSVSSLPKADIFILDEPGTALDEENMEGFIRILELIKVYFKNVLLISHLDSLKDCVDMQIVIEKHKGYAKINQ